MILLDTNVISELMHLPMEGPVASWLNRQDEYGLWTTAVNIFEIRTGLSRLPAGRRRTLLERSFDVILIETLGGRVAPVDREAADAAGHLAAKREKLGRPVEIRDTLIAGVAISRNATIATRNVKHFLDFGARLDDPWSTA